MSTQIRLDGKTVGLGFPGQRPLDFLFGRRLSLPCWLRPGPLMVIVASLLLTGVSPVTAQSISGKFADKGIVLGSNNGGSPDSVSLHALFELQLDPELGLATHPDSADVEIQLARDRLQVNVLNREGAEISRLQLDIANYDAEAGHGVMVRFQSPGSKDDSVVLMLERTTDQHLLKVKVMHLEATSFGPKLRPKGTYFFNPVN